MFRHLLIPATAAALVASPAAVSAQQWKLGIDGGRIRSTLDPSARESGSVAAGFGFEDPTTALRITTGIPTNTDSPWWGAIGGWKRFSARKNGAFAGIDLSGNGFLFQDRKSTTSGGGLLGTLPTSSSNASGNAIAGQALPLVGFATGPFELQARAGVSHYAASIRGENRDRTVTLGDIQLAFQPTQSFALIPVVRRFQPHNEKAATFAGLSGIVADGRVSLWGSAGQWLDGVDTTANGKTAWSAGGSLRLTERASMNAAARRDGFDPLYLNPPQTSWSVGLSVLLGAQSKSLAAPVPAVYDRGMATIRLPVTSSATAPRVAGDFNRWTPATMERSEKFWSYTVAAAPGVYNYSFVSVDGTWFVPESVPGRKDDGMGGQVAVLVIR